MVAGWVLLVVPVLIFSLAMGVYALPRVAATAWASLGRQRVMLEDHLATGDAVGIPLRILSILAIALPVLASVYLLIRLVRSVARGVWRSTEGMPVRRGTAALAALAILAALAFAWWPRPDTYVPIQPTDSGTVLDALPVNQAAPVRLQEGEVGAAQTLWAAQEDPPTQPHLRSRWSWCPATPTRTPRRGCSRSTAPAPRSPVTTRRSP